MMMKNQITVIYEITRSHIKVSGIISDP